MAGILQQQHLDQLRKATEPKKIGELLQLAGNCTLPHSALLKSYHDLLLYYCAFPATKTILTKAKKELNRLGQTIHWIVNGKNTAAKICMSGSGIIHTSLVCAYSYAVVSRLAHLFPGAVAISGSDAEPEDIIPVMQLLLPGIEFEKATQRPLGLVSRLKAISGIQSPAGQLQWLIRLFQESRLDESLKEMAYQQLKIFVSWKLDHPAFSRTFISIPVKKICCTTNLSGTITGESLLREPVKPVQLHAAEKVKLTDIMKVSLAFYYRETDPFTFADPAETTLFEMGNGLTIVLAGMNNTKRLSLESYIGYMAFKNGIPVAYGGGWVWGQRCKIGLNIFPPFRKGESARIFCQVLRLYHQFYKVNQFIVRPYQFGKANPEGIRSGAFWFYYKLGFRPGSPPLFKLAESEWAKKHAGLQYRTPPEVLKKFTAANLEWLTDNKSVPRFGADELSAAISKQINKMYRGSRAAAISASSKRIHRLFSRADLRAVNLLPATVKDNFLLLCLFIRDISLWSPEEKTKLVRVWTLKAGGRERDHILQLQRHRRLWKSIHAGLKKQGARN